MGYRPGNTGGTVTPPREVNLATLTGATSWNLQSEQEVRYVVDALTGDATVTLTGLSGDSQKLEVMVKETAGHDLTLAGALLPIPNSGETAATVLITEEGDYFIDVTGGGDLPTGTSDQLMGFDSNGNAIAVDVDTNITPGDIGAAAAADLTAHLTDASAAHAASAISIAAIAGMDATTAQAAFEELLTSGGGTTLASADGGSPTSTYGVAEFIDGGIP